jgi:hypothetical protein
MAMVRKKCKSVSPTTLEKKFTLQKMILDKSNSLNSCSCQLCVYKKRNEQQLLFSFLL